MAATKVKVVLNHAGIGAMLKGPEIRSDMRARAGRVADAARASAPVVSGAYRDSIVAFDVTTDRAVGRAGASVDYADVVESRTGNLARALDAAA